MKCVPHPNARIEAQPGVVVNTGTGYGMIGGALVQIKQFQIVPLSWIKEKRREAFAKIVRVSRN